VGRWHSSAANEDAAFGAYERVARDPLNAAADDLRAPDLAPTRGTYRKRSPQRTTLHRGRGGPAIRGVSARSELGARACAAPPQALIPVLHCRAWLDTAEQSFASDGSRTGAPLDLGLVAGSVRVADLTAARMTAGRRKARLEREHDSLGLASLAWTPARGRRPSTRDLALSMEAPAVSRGQWRQRTPIASAVLDGSRRRTREARRPAS
jgi:hypothetical protein